MNNDVYKIVGPLRKRTTTHILGFEISGINTQLLNQAPDCNIYNGFFYDTFHCNNSPAPLYSIYCSGKELKITLYLRCYLIHFNKSKNLTIIKNNAIGDKMFFDTTKQCNYIINAHMFPCLYKFTFGIISTILDNYNMCKKGIIITAVFDIFFEVLKKFKVRTKNNLYQLMLTVIKVFINNLLFVTKKK